MLHRLAMFSVGEAGLEPVLGEIVEVAIAISNAEFGNIQLLDAESSELKNPSSSRFSAVVALTSGTELIRVKALAAQRLGGGTRHR
jgi:hypothetical protein